MTHPAFCTSTAVPLYVPFTSTSRKFSNRRPAPPLTRRFTRVIPHDVKTTSVASGEDETFTNHHNPSIKVVTNAVVTSPTFDNDTKSTSNSNNDSGEAIINVTDNNNNTNLDETNSTEGFSLTVDEISNLADVVEKADLADFRYEHEGFIVEISRPGGLGFDREGNLNPIPTPNNATIIADANPVQQYQPFTIDPSAEEEEEVVEEEEESTIENSDTEEESNDPDKILDSDFVVTSNRVGFFFCGAKNKPPLVNVGDTVAYNQPVCIIEQLGQQYVYLSEAAGKVVKVFVEDGDAVEYGSQIMVIRPD